MEGILYILLSLLVTALTIFALYKGASKLLKKMHKLMLDSYFGPFILTFFICLFIFLMQFLWKYVDDLMGKGIEWHVIAELLFYATASLVPMALPLSILLSSIMTFGNLGEKSELIAMKSAGMSLFRIMSPLIVFTVLTSGAAFYFSNYLWPVANLKFTSLLWDITAKKPTMNLKPGVFYNGIEGYSIRIQDKDQDKGTIQDLLIYDHLDHRNPNRKVISAKSGIMKRSDDGRYLVLTLIDGTSYEEADPRQRRKGETSYYPHTTNRFEQHNIRFDLSGFNMNSSSEDQSQGNFKMLNVSQLQAAEDSLVEELSERHQEYAEYLNHSLIVLSDSVPVSFDTITASTGFYSNMSLQEKVTTAAQTTDMVRKHYNFAKRLDEEFGSREKYIDRHKIEWHRKFTLSFACIILFFIGAPLGAIIRKGGLGMPVVFSVGLFLSFHIISLTGEKMAKSAVLDPWLGMWLSTLIFFPLGVLLTYKAAQESSLFAAEFWKKLFSWMQRTPKKQTQSTSTGNGSENHTPEEHFDNIPKQ
jgi:lipopolysaccharide export system permease protein